MTELPLLSWAKSKKIETPGVHADKYQSDSGIRGTYVQNMTPEDQRRWKAKYVGGEDPRVEVRVTLGQPGVQVLMVMRSLHEVELSMNGKLYIGYDVLYQLSIAGVEADERLKLEYDKLPVKRKRRQ